MTYVVEADDRRAVHATGEVVWGAISNYLEAVRGPKKYRPVVILCGRDGQHRVVGLTTQPSYKTTGCQRPEVPVPDDWRMNGDTSYVWSPKPSRLCRLDVAGHIGWVTHEVVDVLEASVCMPAGDREALREAADAHAGERCSR